jgi:hypothetical protein
MTATLAALVWFAVFVAFHWLSARRLAPSWRGRALVVGYGACVLGLVLTAGLLTVDPGRRAPSAVFGVMTMSCLFVLYAPCYFVVTNSLSVQSIVVLLERGGRLPYAELHARFAGRRLLESRLATLERSGHVARVGTGFRLTPRGRRLIAPFLALKSLWRLGPGG